MCRAPFKLASVQNVVVVIITTCITIANFSFFVAYTQATDHQLIRTFLPLVNNQNNGPIAYWGVYNSAVPFPALDDFETLVQKRVAIVHWDQPWQRNGSYQPFQIKDVDSVRARGSIPMISWSSWDYCCGTIQDKFQLADIYNGEHDTYIRQWASDAKAWGHPLFVRFDHEMNGWWQFPWSEQLNGNHAGDYVLAWRHVHDLFKQVGATNITWVWSPNIVSSGTTPLPSLYPGDSYVDWLAMDAYNFGSNGYPGSVWQTFSEVISETYQALQQLAPNKAIMLAEWASAESGDGGAMKAAWIHDALDTQIPNNFPAIKAAVWFNQNAEPGRTWTIDSSPASLNAFRAAITSPYYATNQFGALDLSPIPPPSAAVANSETIFLESVADT